MSQIIREKLGMEFPWEEIEKTRDIGGLLTLEIELSRLCNFSCKYCYSSADKPLNHELEFEEIENVIKEAQTLGARRIIVIGGGEPLIYPRIKDIITMIRRRGLSVVIFTNGTGLDRSLAEFLYLHQVGIELKMNSSNPDIQNELCGIDNAYDIIANALKNLESAGYPGENKLLGISTIICRQNYEELTELWRWARQNDIVPYFETLTPQGRGKNEELCVTTEMLQKIFERLSNIDKEEFNLEWDSMHPPLAGMTCNRHLYSCYVRSDGAVLPCAGIDIVTGNIRTESLEYILNTSPVHKELRHADKLVKGKCGSCSIKPKCYGCRGVAFQQCGDYLAQDPSCWHCNAMSMDK